MFHVKHPGSFVRASMIAHKRAPRAVASARGAKDAPPNRPANWAHSVRDAAGALPLHPREDVQMFHVKHRGASAQLAASLNGKKASNSEEISRLDRVRRKAARKSTLTNRRYAQGGLSFALAIRAGDSEFDAFSPFAALSAAKPGSTCTAARRFPCRAAGDQAGRAPVRWPRRASEPPASFRGTGLPGLCQSWFNSGLPLSACMKGATLVAKKALSRIKRHRLRGNASVLTKQRGRMQVASGRTLQPLEQDAAYASAMPRLKSMIF